ncbi:MAG: hypothetical protein AAF690_28250, partial [Acidobacteriota bacterium]
MSRNRSLLCASLGALLLFSLHVADPLEGSCVVCSPAAPVPSSLWGSLEPRGILEDQTSYVFNFEPGCNVPFYFELAMGQDLIFAATGNAVQVWDTGADVDDPPQLGEACTPVLGTWKKTDTDFYVGSVGTVRGNDNFAVAAIGGGMGMAIIDARNRNFPGVIYQDEGVFNSSQSLSGGTARAASIGGRDYGFVKSFGAEIFVYDVTSALSLNVPCHDSSQATVQCPGVYQGKWPGTYFGSMDAEGNRMLTSGGAGGVVQFWDTTSPAAPVLLGSLPSSSLVTEMWLQNGVYYAAVGNDQVVDVYQLPSFNPVVTLQTPGSDLANSRKTRVSRIVHSNDNGLHYLHAVHGSTPGEGPQR